MAKSKREMSSDFRDMYLKNNGTKNPDSELESTRMDDGNLPLEDHNWDDLNDQLRAVERHYKQVTGETYNLKGKKTNSIRWRLIHDIYVFLDEHREWLDLHHGALKAISNGVGGVKYDYVKDAVEFMKRNNLMPHEEPEQPEEHDIDGYNYPYYF